MIPFVDDFRASDWGWAAALTEGEAAKLLGLPAAIVRARAEHDDLCDADDDAPTLGGPPLEWRPARVRRTGRAIMMFEAESVHRLAAWLLNRRSMPPSEFEERLRVAIAPLGIVVARVDRRQRTRGAPSAAEAIAHESEQIAIVGDVTDPSWFDIETAARLLAISAPTLRSRCAAGLIEGAVKRPSPDGGEMWAVPARSIARSLAQTISACATRSCRK